MGILKSNLCCNGMCILKIVFIGNIELRYFLWIKINEMCLRGVKLFC